MLGTRLSCFSSSPPPPSPPTHTVVIAQVNYRETITMKSPIDYVHKKQTGGSGQYAKVQGYIEPLTEEEVQALAEEGKGNLMFENHIIGNNIPPEYIGAVEKGVEEAMAKGQLVGHPVTGVRFVLEDGAAHAVDSSELAFRTAAIQAFRQAVPKAGATVMEPIMAVEVEAPSEFQGAVMGELSKRKGLIQDSDLRDGNFVANVHVALEVCFWRGACRKGGTGAWMRVGRGILMERCRVLLSAKVYPLVAQSRICTIRVSACVVTFCLQ